MIFTRNTNGRAGMIVVTVETLQPIVLRLIAYDKKQPKIIYLKHKVAINRRSGNRYVQQVLLQLPLSPNELEVILFVKKEGIKKDNNSKLFRVTSVKSAELPTCPIFMTPETISFFKLAFQFAKKAAILSCGKGIIPHIYRSDDGRFNIDYFDKIRNKNGFEVNTPARINHGSAIIQAAKNDFSQYSVMQIVVILGHEYSHRFLNPQINRRISDEVAADINALLICYSLGFSPLEALTVFLKVFNSPSAKNAMNKRRYLILKKFTDDYFTGKINTCQAKSEGAMIKNVA